MKAIIFDVGGTLLEDLDFDFKRGLRFLYDEVLDVKESYEDFLKFVDSYYEVFERRKTSDLEINFYSYLNYLRVAYGFKTNLSYEEIEDIFVKKIYHTNLLPGLKEFLDYLKKSGYELYVLSNTLFTTREIRKELEDAGILHYFDYVVATGDHLVRKPSVMVFNMYLKRLNHLKPSEIAYIGNEALIDMPAPVKLGMKAFLKSNRDYDNEGYHEFSSYYELLRWFKDNG